MAVAAVIIGSLTALIGLALLSPAVALIVGGVGLTLAGLLYDKAD